MGRVAEVIALTAEKIFFAARSACLDSKCSMSNYGAHWPSPTARSPKCKPAKARRWPQCRGRLVREIGLGCSRDDRQRLSGSPRRAMDGRHLRIPGTFRRAYPTGHGSAKIAARAYACDITYATANEIGFDILRDGLALHPREQVHRPFAAAVIDEADSILIDEARIPLVIAGGDAGEEPLAYAGGSRHAILPARPIITRSTSTPGTLRSPMRESARWKLRSGAAICSTRKSSTAHRHSGFPARPRLAAPRRRLSGERRRHRIGGRIQRPHSGEPALAGRIAHRHRSQGRPGAEDARPNSRIHHTAKPDLAVSEVCGMTGTAATQAEELRLGVWLGSGGNPHQPAHDPRGSSRRVFCQETG